MVVVEGVHGQAKGGPNEDVEEEDGLVRDQLVAEEENGYKLRVYKDEQDPNHDGGGDDDA